MRSTLAPRSAVPTPPPARRCRRRHDGRGRVGHWSRISAPNRLVGIVLQRLGAVLEESAARPRSRIPRGRPSPRPGRAGDADVGTEPLEVRELLLRRAGWHEHDRADSDRPARPRDGGAVIAGRGGDDASCPSRASASTTGQGASPLEDAELVLVLPLQPEVGQPAKRAARRELVEVASASPCATLAGARSLRIEG
jgi:hypothetical protein